MKNLFVALGVGVFLGLSSIVLDQFLEVPKPLSYIKTLQFGIFSAVITYAILFFRGARDVQ